VKAAMTATETAIARLDLLGTELTQRGCAVRLQLAAGRIPSLLVQNPASGGSVRSEHIYAAPRTEGWFYWWPWAEPIAETPADAASIITRSLTE
jgi:hypothetical protein